MDALVMLSTPSFWSFIFFHYSTKVTWKMIKDEDDDYQSSLNIDAKYIHGDCLNKNFDYRIHGTNISKWFTDESMSNTQQQLLEKLAMSSDFLPNLLICNTITNAVNKHPTLLHVALSVHLHRKRTIMHMHDYLAIAWEIRIDQLYMTGVVF